MEKEGSKSEEKSGDEKMKGSESESVGSGSHGEDEDEEGTVSKATNLGSSKNVPKPNNTPSKRARAAAAADAVDAIENARKLRVWSEGDEISILEGMIDYRKQLGAEPHSDMAAFLEFVKGRFAFDPTKTQLYEKVRRLRERFLRTVEKADPLSSLTKVHDKECFELSRQIWGSNNGIVGKISVEIEKGENSGRVRRSTKRQKKMKKKAENEVKMQIGREEEEDDDGKKRDFESMYPNVIQACMLMPPASLRKCMIENVSAIDREKARELEEGWKKLQVEHIKMYSKQLELRAQQARLVVDSMKEEMDI